MHCILLVQHRCGGVLLVNSAVKALSVCKRERRERVGGIL